MARSSGCFLPGLLIVLALLAVSPLQTHSQRVPAYSEIMSQAASIIDASRSGETRKLLTHQLEETWPLLFSPTRFQHELVKATDRLAKNGFLRPGGKLPFNLSAECVDNVLYSLISLAERQSWAWQMVDAMGKPSPNLKGFNLLWVGAYEECLAVKAYNSSTPTSSPLFTGRHCYSVAPLIQTPTIKMNLASSLCAPSSCSGYDLSVMLNVALYELNITLPSKPYVSCQNKEQPPLDNLAIAAICVLGVFGFLLLLGTTVDVVHTHLPNWRAKPASGLSTNHHFFNQHDTVVLLGDQPSQIPEPRFVSKLFMAFSVYTNGAKLLSTDQAAGTLSCVHGIRFLSMTWVVLGHCFLMPMYCSTNIADYYTEVIKRWTFQGIINASVSVDTFFLLSGLLVSYLSLRELKRTAGKINWFKFYFHRYWRLTPPYMLIILVYMALGRYWGWGPMWADAVSDRDNCRTEWWTNILYINNFVSTKGKACLGQSWYLANDMQFYILSPLIFVPLYCSPVCGLVSALFFLIATTVPPAALTMKWHLTPGSAVAVDAAKIGDGFDDYYVKPYCRMGPYIIGMLTGYLLYRTDCRMRIHKAVNFVCWAAATAVALAVLYGLYHASQGHPMPLWESALYNSLARTAWGLAVAWVVFACVTGNGGFVNTILSWKALVPLSRLTYCIYLLHIMMLYGYLFSRDSAFYFSDANMVVLFLAVLVACYLLSAVVSLMFEAPMLALEKVILNYRRNV